jgi:hypothetical protein
MGWRSCLYILILQVPDWQLFFPEAKHYGQKTTVDKMFEAPLTTASESKLLFSASKWWLLTLKLPGFGGTILCSNDDTEKTSAMSYSFTLSSNGNVNGGVTGGSSLRDATWDLPPTKRSDKKTIPLFYYVLISLALCAVLIGVQCFYRRKMHDESNSDQRDNFARNVIICTVVVNAILGLFAAANVGVLGATTDIPGAICVCAFICALFFLCSFLESSVQALSEVTSRKRWPADRLT